MTEGMSKERLAEIGQIFAGWWDAGVYRNAGDELYDECMRLMAEVEQLEIAIEDAACQPYGDGLPDIGRITGPILRPELHEGR